MRTDKAGFSSNKRVRARFGALAAMAGAALAMWIVAAPAATAFEPQDFDVKLQMGGMDQPQQPSCTNESDGTMVCKQDFSYVKNGVEAKGTVTRKSTGEAGTIEVTCDFEMEVHSSMRFSTATGTGSVDRFDGNGRQSCAWHMDFGGGSTLTGKMTGTMKMSLLDSATGTVEIAINFKVDVVHGTGSFADQVGSGTFSETEQMKVFEGAPSGPPSGGPPSGSQPPGPPPEGPPPAGPASLASTGPGALAGGSPMNLKLRKGATAVKIVYPLDKLGSDDKSALHAVTAPGSSCRAEAKKGKKRIKLGKDRADANGDVTIADGLASKLGKGKAKLSIACTTKGKRGKGVAKASASVTVA